MANTEKAYKITTRAKIVSILYPSLSVQYARVKKMAYLGQALEMPGQMGYNDHEKRGGPPMSPSRKNQKGHELMNVDSLYAFLYCTLASNVLLNQPIMGGSLYLAGHAAVIFLHSRRQLRREIISPALRRTGFFMAIGIALLSLVIMAIAPITIESEDFWLLAALVLCILLRPEITRYSLEKSAVEKRRTGGILGRLCLIQLAFLPPMALMLFLSPMGKGAAWSLLGGYVVSGLLESLTLSNVRYTLTGYTDEEKETLQQLSGVHAYRMYQNTAIGITAALQITLVIVYTYLAVTADRLIVSMALALLCTYAAYFATDALLKKRIRKTRDQSILTCVGLAIWLGGLVNFISTLDHPTLWQSSLSLVLCTVGATVCTRSMSRMEKDMQRVAIFGLGRNPGSLTDASMHIRLQYATLLGQLLSLIGLLLISIFARGDFPADWETLFLSFSPLLTLPAVCLVTVALIFALSFPMTYEHMAKLRHYLDLQEKGEENTPLKNQLEAVVIKKSLKRYGIRLIILLIRPFYRHKVLGREHVKPDKDIPCIFVSNHGEIYGPVVNVLFVPYSFRPWTTFEMIDPALIADRVCGGFLKEQKVLPKKFCFFLVDKIAAPFLSWIMRQVESIPVYHDNPRKLMLTFRETVAAMEAGDNILIFPENPAADGKYRKEGVSEFFSGFTLTGQMYHARTGKCCQFIPLYANKEKRTITFGTPTRYNPDNAPADESQRLCTVLRQEMIRLSQL